MLQVVSNRYRVLDELGTGGMGTVYQVRDVLTGDVLAMKKLHHHTCGDAGLTPSNALFSYNALTREFQLLTSLRHPNIVAVHDFGIDGARCPYFTMELLDTPLNATALVRRDLPVKIHALIEVLQALTYLHQCQILHGDIKPSNILIIEDKYVKLVDFGLAGQIADYRHGFGTFAYLAPELIRREAPTPASDLYALGLVAYELLTGQFPFATESLGRLFDQILHKDIPTTMEQIPAELRPIMARWLAKNPAERYQDARILIHALCEATGTDVPGETPTIQASFLRAARFVGRSQEIAVLHRAVTDARLGEGTSWLIAGASGMGKSRLMAELRAYALLNGFHVIRVDAPEVGGDPYYLLRKVLLPLLPMTDIQPAEASVLKIALPEIDRFLEYAVPPAPDLGIEQNHERLAAVILAMLSRQNTPLLLLVEDIHQALDNLPVIRHLVQMTNNREMMVVCSYRSDECADLRQHLPDVRQLALNPLSQDEVRQLIEAMLGSGGLSQPFVDSVAAYAEGNVFFIVDLLQALARRTESLNAVGQLTLHEERFLSPGVVEVAQRRLGRVPRRFHPALYLAAVLGRDIDTALLRHIDAEITDDEQWLSLCAASGILSRQDGNWVFDHDTVRAGLLENLPADEQSNLHRAAAEAIEAVYPNQEIFHARLLNHWREAGDLQKEQHYLEMVTRRLSDQGFPREARRLLETALPRFRHDAAITARLLFQLALAHKLLGEYQQSIQVAQQGEQLATQLESPQTLRNFVSLLGALAREQGDFRLAESYQQRSLEIAYKLEDRLAIAQGLVNLAAAKASLGEIDQSDSLIREAYALTESLNHPLGMTLTVAAMGNIARFRGDLAAALAFFERSLALSREHGFAAHIAQALNGLAVIHADQHMHDLAAAALQESIELARRIGDHRMLAQGLAIKGLLLERAGLPGAEEPLLEGLQLAHALNLTPTIMVALIGLAHHELANGDPVTGAKLAGFVAAENRLLAYNRDHLEKLLVALRAVLDEDVLSRVLSERQETSLEQWVGRYLPD